MVRRFATENGQLRTGFSNPFQFPSSTLVHHIAGVQRARRLAQQEPAFFICHRLVLHPPRHHDELAFFNPYLPVAKFHAKAPFHHQKHLVFMVVMVKHKLTLQLAQLHLLPIEFGSNVGLPIFVDLGELLRDVDFVHATTMTCLPPRSQENCPFQLESREEKLGRSCPRAPELPSRLPTSPPCPHQRSQLKRSPLNSYHSETCPISVGTPHATTLTGVNETAVITVGAKV